MSISKFYDLEARKILADGEKIGLFTQHPGALGAFREARLRQYVAEHVPSRYAVSSGFITSHDPEGTNIYDDSSKQIDCLVHDATAYAPLLQTTDFSIVSPGAAVAILEVKSDLTLFKSRPKNGEPFPCTDEKGGFAWAGTLIDALTNIKSAIGILEAAGVPRDNYFAGIMSYRCGAISQFVSAMTSGELMRQLELTNIDQMPSDICVFDESWFGISAYQWVEDPEHDFDTDADPAWSFLLVGKAITEGGSLQLFTAGLNFAITVARNREKHVTGGLRSGVGYDGPVDNHKIPLPSPRQHRG